MRRFGCSMLLVTAALVTACSIGGRQPAVGDRDPRATVAAASPSSPPASPPEGIGGLLIARDSGIVVRSMADGTERSIKPAVPATAYTYPRWSPDGTRIAYARIAYPTQPNQQDWGTQVVLLEGAAERVVFKKQVPGLTVDGLAWAAGGRGLYLATYDPTGAGALKLELLDLDSGTLTMIADGAAYPIVAPPDGRIAFMTFSKGLESGGLWIAKADGSERRRLMSVPGLFAGLRGPRFSPDGQWLAFGAVEPAFANDAAPTCTSGRRWPWQPRVASAHGPPIGIWVMPVAGGTPRRVSDLVEDDPAVAWSPDGSELAVIGACGLYRITVATGAVQKLGPGATFSQIDWR